MRSNQSQKGITLIALIITIAILLILAAVSIIAIKNDGIMGHAQSQKDKYDKLAQEKNELLKNYIDYINNESVGSSNESSNEDKDAPVVDDEEDTSNKDNTAPKAPTITLETGTVTGVTSALYQVSGAYRYVEDFKIIIKANVSDDADSGVDYVEYSIMYNGNVLEKDIFNEVKHAFWGSDYMKYEKEVYEDGTYVIKATTYDKAGNASTTTERTITIKEDVIAPSEPIIEVTSGTLSPRNNGTYISDEVKITITPGTDNKDGSVGVGVGTTKYSIDGGITWKDNEEIVFEKEGTYTIQATTSDKLYNTSKVATLTITINKKLANMIVASNYGDKIEYTATNGLNDWEVFYCNGTNVYLIYNGYLDRKYIPENVKQYMSFSDRVSSDTYQIYWPNSYATFANENAESLFTYIKDGDKHSSYAQKFYLSDFYNYRADENDTESYWVSTSNWARITTDLIFGYIGTDNWTSNLKDKNGLALAAAGTPTLDLWRRSWNEKIDEDLSVEFICNKENNENGYILKDGGEKITSYKNSKEVDTTLYFPSVNNYVKGYWLASGSYGYVGMNNTTKVYRNGLFGIYSDKETLSYINRTNEAYLSLRPVVCLSSNVYGTYKSSGWSQLRVTE